LQRIWEVSSARCWLRRLVTRSANRLPLMADNQRLR
jgi:hypothetical protein